MESGEREKHEQRTKLNRQHLAEWNDQLAHEVQNRMTLEEQHKQDFSRSYLEEINVYDRTMLETQQRQALHELVQQNRLARINLLRRHTRENNALNQ